jgi:hypothetical protein
MAPKIKDPLGTVGTKPKKAPGGHKTKSAPNFTTTDYLKVESNVVPNFSDEQETRYLERIKLRSKLELLDPGSVPQASDFEAMLRQVNIELNTMYASGSQNNEAGYRNRANLEILYSRFGTRNLFNVAHSIATSRLQEQSIKEFKALVADPNTAVATVLGTGAGSDNIVDASRTGRRQIQQIGVASEARRNLFGFNKVQLTAAAAAMP